MVKRRRRGEMGGMHQSWIVNKGEMPKQKGGREVGGGGWVPTELASKRSTKRFSTTAQSNHK
jgi:hypothetical protein